MDRVRDQFVAAAEMAARAGFDMLELHCAHGYLLSSFITPLTNRRTDEYGGSLENRMRYPLEIFRAVRAAWPAEKPISVRISANDWVGGEGIEPRDAVEIGRMLQEAGVDICDVSAGQTSIRAQPVYGRMFQTPFSDRIRNETGMATMAVGNIYEPDHVNSILMAGPRRPRLPRPAASRRSVLDPARRRASSATAARHGPSPITPAAISSIGCPAAASLRRRRYDDDDSCGQTRLGDRRRHRHRRRDRVCAGAGRRQRHDLRPPRRSSWNSPPNATRTFTPQAADVTDEMSIAQLYRAGAKGARAIRHRRRQCRARRRARRPKRSRRELWNKTLDVNLTGAFFSVQARARRHARAQMGPHHLRRLDGGTEGLSLCGALCRRQARRRRACPRLGGRNRQGRDHRECGLPRLHRNLAARSALSTVSPTTNQSAARPRRARALLPHNPQGRFIQPQEVADAVLWLCQEGSGAITGQAISVSGGETW